MKEHYYSVVRLKLHKYLQYGLDSRKRFCWFGSNISV